jgi:rhodanese-related sulfurtransferase
MSLFRSIKQLFVKPEPKPFTRPLPPLDLELEEIPVPEISVAALQAELASDQPPLLLDVREHFEWNQVRIPDALHIPMNDLPNRLAELPKASPIVVFCAHGSRSYSVAHFLLEQGYLARSLAGGITQWHVQGNAVQVGTR